MKVAQIKEICDVEIEGDLNLEVHSIARIDELGSGSLGFIDGDSDAPNLDALPSDCCLIVSESLKTDFEGTLVRSKAPKFDFATVAEKLAPRTLLNGRHPSAHISENADCRAAFVGPNVVIEDGAYVGECAEIHAGSFIGKNSSVGKYSIINPDVSIYENVQIEQDCIVHSGARIGAPGFGYVQKGAEIVRFPQIGKVIIRDRVEIGANTCIDRGSLDDTVIEEDTKIDNLCQIAHNVKIGKRVRIAAHVGISGSAVIEDDVLIGGQVGIADHVIVKSGAVLGARSAVFPGKIVRKGVWAGTPVRPLEKYKKENALIRSLGRLSEEVEKLKDQK